MSNERKSYNLALSIYRHVRHGDYKGAKYLLVELISIVEDICKEDEEKQKLEESKNGR